MSEVPLYSGQERQSARPPSSEKGTPFFIIFVYVVYLVIYDSG